MAARSAYLRGIWLWRAASAGGWQQGAPGRALEQLGARWQVQPGVGGARWRQSACAWGQQPFWLHTAGMAHENSGDEGEGDGEHRQVGRREPRVTAEEVQQVLRHVNLTSLKHRLDVEAREHMGLAELLDLCEAERVARSPQEAAEVVRALDSAGVVFVFRDRVFLHPEAVAKQVAKALPLALALEDDPRKEEFDKLQIIKEQIDMLAHKKVRKNLLAGLLVLTGHFLVFFRLTFWEFSWDVMEPIAFFVTTGALLAGYAYFLATATDPSYQDLHERLFVYHQKKLMKKMKFDNKRFQHLAKQCSSCFSTSLHFTPVSLLKQRDDDD